jgi:hypothetical protein
MLRARGLEEETLLLYTADNGPEGQDTKGYHGQLPGDNPGKGTWVRPCIWMNI